MNTSGFTSESESSTEHADPIVNEVAINKARGQPVGEDGWHAVYYGEKLLVEVNWGLQNELSFVDRFKEVGDDYKEKDKKVRVQVRWCSEDAALGEKGERLWKVIDRALPKFITEKTTPSVDATDENGTSEEKTTFQPKTVSDPLNLQGQQMGALLQVMRTPERIKKVKKGAEFNMIVEVGDICEVIETAMVPFKGKERSEYVIDNLRTGVRVIVP